MSLGNDNDSSWQGDEPMGGHGRWVRDGREVPGLAEHGWQVGWRAECAARDCEDWVWEHDDDTVRPESPACSRSMCMSCGVVYTSSLHDAAHDAPPWHFLIAHEVCIRGGVVDPASICSCTRARSGRGAVS